MKAKVIYLFLALLLPGLIFVFLRFFGKNEFSVEPLYQTTPPRVQGCGSVSLPYVVPDSILSHLEFNNDSLVVIVFEETSADGLAQLDRVSEEIEGDPIHIIHFNPVLAGNQQWKRCSFFLKEPFNTILVDHKGSIRGEYTMHDRKEVDRLLTEITIILKKY